MVRSAVKLQRVLATDLRFTRDRLAITLNDGREVSVPLAWYPTLQSAGRAHRARWELLNEGAAIYWPDLDLDLSIGGLINGFREAILKPPIFKPANR